jgi:hypothetical protein
MGHLHENDNDGIEVCRACGYVVPCICKAKGVEARIDAAIPMPEPGTTLTPPEIAAIVAARSKMRLELHGVSLSQQSADEHFNNWREQWGKRNADYFASVAFLAVALIFSAMWWGAWLGTETINSKPLNGKGETNNVISQSRTHSGRSNR